MNFTGFLLINIWHKCRLKYDTICSSIDKLNEKMLYCKYFLLKKSKSGLTVENLSFLFKLLLSDKCKFCFTVWKRFLLIDTVFTKGTFLFSSKDAGTCVTCVISTQVPEVTCGNLTIAVCSQNSVSRFLKDRKYIDFCPVHILAKNLKLSSKLWYLKLA